VASCKECQVGFVLPLPTESELKVLYDSLEYHDGDRGAGNFWEFDEPRIAAQIQKDSAFVRPYQQHVPPTGHVLDVGAGWGTLLKSFADRGFRTTGIEISTTACEFARTKLGLNVFNLPIERLDELPEEKYDLVTMRHVMEHFYDPGTVLQQLHQRMKPDARIIIVVPDYGSYDRKKYGPAWPAFGPYHLWYFTRPSLQRLLADSGFDVIHFHTFLSERILSRASSAHRLARRVVNRLGAKRLFSGRSIGLIARKNETEPV
jgi:SAM-dependent methyltransferase